MSRILYTLTTDGKRIHIAHPLHPSITLCALPTDGEPCANVAAIGRELPFCYPCKGTAKDITEAIR